jgi:hypothetical protein
MEPWTARTYIRAGFAAVLALLGALGTALVGDQSISPGEWIAALTVTLTAAGGWLGFGALPNTQIEPFFGAQGDQPVKVPDKDPPAVPTPEGH